jgi:hypothetical protein
MPNLAGPCVDLCDRLRNATSCRHTTQAAARARSKHNRVVIQPGAAAQIAVELANRLRTATVN